MRFTKICFNVVNNVLDVATSASTTAITAKQQFQVKIGLEIHARILSKTKIFSNAETNSFVNTLCNSKVSYFDAALPGTMPTLNKRCVEAALLTALALNCKINSISYFERKHYFYPDLPSGYQITQQKQPIAFDGYYEYPLFDRKLNKVNFKLCNIKRIQLEHDSARTILMNDLNTNDNTNESKKGEQSLIDLNRCGLGLMEIVTEPNFQDSIDTSSFVYELANLLKTLNVCDVNMKEGGFRVDCNISVHKILSKNESTNESKLEDSSRIEIKNLNNLNTLRKAIDYEINRQINLKLANKQHEIVMQTRGYDSLKEETFLMRIKDTFYDYRFMPEPNLPPLFVYTINNKQLISNNQLILNEDYDELLACKTINTSLNIDYIIQLKSKFHLPDEKRVFLCKKYFLTNEQAYMIVQQKLDDLFINMMNLNENLNNLNANISKIYYNCLLYEYKEAINLNKDHDAILTIEKLVDYINLIKKKLINKRLCKLLFQLMVKEENKKKLPSQIRDEYKMFIIYDENIIMNCINKVLDANSDAVKKYHKKEKYRVRMFNGFKNGIQEELKQCADTPILEKLLIEALDKRKKL